MQPNAGDTHRLSDTSRGVPLDAPARLTLATSAVLGVTIVVTGFQLSYPELRDNHGPALLVGAGLAVLMLNDRWR